MRIAAFIVAVCTTTSAFAQEPLHIDFLLMTYAPGGSSSSTGELMRHPGWEYGYLLHGALVLTLGFDELTLTPGDAVSFDSTTAPA